MTEKINPLGEYKIRLNRLEKIRKAGINPYPSIVKQSHTIGEILKQFNQLKPVRNTVTIVGRLLGIRSHGSLTFAKIQGESGAIQLALSKKEMNDTDYQNFSQLIDVGDFLQVSGECFVTHKGEKSLLVKNWVLLSKSLLPLPEKWHGLADIETRFRKRYLDLIANPEVKEIFRKRTMIIQYIRDYFVKEGFIEVETPVLQPVASGAMALPFKTHHHALNTDLYLRIAPELYLKELVIGGFEKVFEIGRCFRNEGIDYAHNPEFTQIEFYWAYQDYLGLMKFVEEFLSDLVKAICGSLTVDYDKQKINFSPPYPRLDFREALIQETSIDLDNHGAKSLMRAAQKKGLKTEKHWGKGKLADELYKKFVRPKLISPTFLINYPIELSPLAKRIPKRSNYVERFQLIVAGKIELMNAFTELNDPLEQAERFKFQQNLAKKGDSEAMNKDEEFVEALKYGLPPCAGLGLGIDRLVNVLTNTHNIKEVILFPTLRPGK